MTLCDASPCVYRKLGGSAGQTAALPSKVAEKNRHKAKTQTEAKASDGADEEDADGTEDKKQSGRYILFVGTSDTAQPVSACSLVNGIRR